MPNKSEWKVGQEVLVVYGDSRRGKPTKATVAKIARKWATLDPAHLGKSEIETGFLQGAPGYSSDGAVWPSAEEFNAHQEREMLWRTLRGSIGYKCPEHLTAQDISEMHQKILGPNQ